MIGFVIVSHSEALAHATVALAMQMIHGERPPVQIASGAAGGFGTDAAAIAEAIDRLSGCSGVLIMTDLGSAVMSSELALDLRTSKHPVRISDGPFVEGATAGIVRAATGGDLDEVAAEASGALNGKRRSQPAPAPAVEMVETVLEGRVSAEQHLVNPLGIHSRPAAMLVRTAGRFASDVRVTNATANRGPVRANSMVGLLSLGASKDHVIRLEAEGPDADEALNAIQQLLLDGFGEVPAE